MPAFPGCNGGAVVPGQPRAAADEGGAQTAAGGAAGREAAAGGGPEGEEGTGGGGLQAQDGTRAAHQTSQVSGWWEGGGEGEVGVR